MFYCLTQSGAITRVFNLPDVFEKEAEQLKSQYDIEEQAWFEKHGDMEYATEINSLEKELDKL